MQLTGQRGVRVYRSGNRVLIAPEERIQRVLAGTTPRASASSLQYLYFYASLSDDGTEVHVAPGLLVFESLAYSGLGIDVDGGSPATPFTATGLIPDTDGYIIYKAEIAFIQDIGSSDELTAGAESIGTGSYYFFLESQTLAMAPDALFIEGAVEYSDTFPAADAGFYRKVIATCSVDGDGLPYNLKQQHAGALFLPFAEIQKITQFSAAVA